MQPSMLQACVIVFRKMVLGRACKFFFVQGKMRVIAIATWVSCVYA
jgi:hypothetical protein